MAFDPASIKAIVFDLDGTLIDSVPDLAAALNEVMCQMKLPELQARQLHAPCFQ